MENPDRLLIVRESTLKQIEDHLVRIHELLSEPEEIENLMPPDPIFEMDAGEEFRKLQEIF